MGYGSAGLSPFSPAGFGADASAGPADASLFVGGGTSGASAPRQLSPFPDELDWMLPLRQLPTRGAMAASGTATPQSILGSSSSVTPSQAQMVSSIHLA